MRKIYFTDNLAPSYEVAILIKPSNLNQRDLTTYYVNSLEAKGISKDTVLAYELYYSSGKVRNADAKEYIKELIEEMLADGIQYIYCADAAYFKLLANQKKAEPHLGDVFPVGDTGMQITLGVNYSGIIYNPANTHKLAMSLTTLKDIINEDFTKIGDSIIHSASYPTSLSDIRDHLQQLSTFAHISCDIEAYSLDFDKAGIGTIGFAIDEHNGFSFGVDYVNNHEPNLPIRALLKEFFETYTGTIIFHNVNYDVKILIYELFMIDLNDMAGMFTGLHNFKYIDDTKIMAYLGLNSTAKPLTSLKVLAHPFAGNYAQDDDDIKDIRRIPLPTLLKYNLIDCLATWYVYNVMIKLLVQDNQLELYNGLMMDSAHLILQIELTGLPLDSKKVAYAKGILQKEQARTFAVFAQFDEVKETMHQIRQAALDKKNKSLKTKVHTIDMEAYQKIVFNPASPQQVQKLLFEVMGFPIISLTKTKQPSVDGDTLDALLNHATAKQLPLIQALIDFNAVAGMLSTFIPAFERALYKGGTVHYLHGSFVIGGTVSGRLSSRNPNMQNLPSSSKFSKLMKECFVAEEGWVMVGADFSSLEDRINALLTNDPNKIKVYTDGYDGHSLRAHSYWPQKMLDIKQVEQHVVCYEINGAYYQPDDELTYQDRVYTVKEFYETFKDTL